MTCSSKGCGDTQAPYLDKDTSKVYCSSCNQEIQNVTIFAKNQMKMSKQFRQKEKKPFAVKCNNCSAEQQPILVKDEVTCSSCQKKMDHLTKPFIIMLKDKLKKVGQDI